jgi:type VI protein secretion system component Hcp
MIRVRFFIFTLLALFGLCLSASEARAGTELYLQFDPALHGSSKEGTHAAWIVVDSYTFGDGSQGVATGAATGTGASGDKAGGLADKTAVGSAADKAGRPTKITFSTSDATVMTELKAAGVRGAHFKTAILDVKKAGKPSSDYAKITLTDVLVSSVTVRPGLQTKAGASTFTLTFVKEALEYSQADANGSRTAAPATTSWDVASGKMD